MEKSLMIFKIANILVSVMALACSNAKANEGNDLTGLAARGWKVERQMKEKIDHSHYLQNRIDKSDKRYASFLMALALLEERGARTIVETGSSRYGSGGFKGDGGSTIIFGDWAAQNKAMVHSVDNNSHHIDAAKNATHAYLQNLSFTCSDSVEFLNKFSNPIDFLYLDSYDFELNNPVPSQEHHLNELVAAYPCLHEKSIVMIDDCDLPHGGMGKLVIDHLKESGWEVVYRGYQVILLRE